MELGNTLAVLDVVHLIKALTLAEQQGTSYWLGSASPVAYLYEALRKRMDSVDDVADWVFRHRDNSYIPFGSPAQCRSLAEYRAWWLTREADLAEERRARWERNSVQHRLEEQRHMVKLALQPGKKTRALANAIRRGDVAAVEALLAKGANPRAVDSEGRTMRAMADAKGDRRILELLRRAGA
jgi:hypothetical protein